MPVHLCEPQQFPYRQETRAIWPAVLTREAVKRLDIKAAVLARSVRTPEGIDLVVPPASGTPAGGETAEASRSIKER
jgi:stage V sporulation protein SpoVS